jgi:hypothetical protein
MPTCYFNLSEKSKFYVVNIRAITREKLTWLGGGSELLLLTSWTWIWSASEDTFPRFSGEDISLLSMQNSQEE